MGLISSLGLRQSVLVPISLCPVHVLFGIRHSLESQVTLELHGVPHCRALVVVQDFKYDPSPPPLFSFIYPACVPTWSKRSFECNYFHVHRCGTPRSTLGSFSSLFSVLSLPSFSCLLSHLSPPLSLPSVSSLCFALPFSPWLGSRPQAELQRPLHRPAADQRQRVAAGLRRLGGRGGRGRGRGFRERRQRGQGRQRQQR